MESDHQNKRLNDTLCLEVTGGEILYRCLEALHNDTNIHEHENAIEPIRHTFGDFFLRDPSYDQIELELETIDELAQASADAHTATHAYLTDSAEALTAWTSAAKSALSLRQKLCRSVCIELKRRAALVRHSALANLMSLVRREYALFIERLRFDAQMCRHLELRARESHRLLLFAAHLQAETEQLVQLHHSSSPLIYDEQSAMNIQPDDEHLRAQKAILNNIRQDFFPTQSTEESDIQHNTKEKETMTIQHQWHGLRVLDVFRLDHKPLVDRFHTIQDEYSNLNQPKSVHTGTTGLFCRIHAESIPSLVAYGFGPIRHMIESKIAMSQTQTEEKEKTKASHGGTEKNNHSLTQNDSDIDTLPDIFEGIAPFFARLHHDRQDHSRQGKTSNPDRNSPQRSAGSDLQETNVFNGETRPNQSNNHETSPSLSKNHETSPSQSKNATESSATLGTFASDAVGAAAPVYLPLWFSRNSTLLADFNWIRQPNSINKDAIGDIYSSHGVRQSLRKSLSTSVSSSQIRCSRDEQTTKTKNEYTNESKHPSERSDHIGQKQNIINKSNIEQSLSGVTDSEATRTTFPTDIPLDLLDTSIFQSILEKSWPGAKELDLASLHNRYVKKYRSTSYNSSDTPTELMSSTVQYLVLSRARFNHVIELEHVQENDVAHYITANQSMQDLEKLVKHASTQIPLSHFNGMKQQQQQHIVDALFDKSRKEYLVLNAACILPEYIIQFVYTKDPIHVIYPHSENHSDTFKLEHTKQSSPSSHSQSKHGKRKGIGSRKTLNKKRTNIPQNSAHVTASIDSSTTKNKRNYTSIQTNEASIQTKDSTNVRHVLDISTVYPTQLFPYLKNKTILDQDRNSHTLQDRNSHTGNSVYDSRTCSSTNATTISRSTLNNSTSQNILKNIGFSPITEHNNTIQHTQNTVLDEMNDVSNASHIHATNPMLQDQDKLNCLPYALYPPPCYVFDCPERSILLLLASSIRANAINLSQLDMEQSYMSPYFYLHMIRETHAGLIEYPMSKDPAIVHVRDSMSWRKVHDSASRRQVHDPTSKPDDSATSPVHSPTSRPDDSATLQVQDSVHSPTSRRHDSERMDTTNHAIADSHTIQPTYLSKTSNNWTSCLLERIATKFTINEISQLHQWNELRKNALEQRVIHTACACCAIEAIQDCIKPWIRTTLQIEVEKDKTENKAAKKEKLEKLQELRQQIVSLRLELYSEKARTRELKTRLQSHRLSSKNSMEEMHVQKNKEAGKVSDEQYLTGTKYEASRPSTQDSTNSYRKSNSRKQRFSNQTGTAHGSSLAGAALAYRSAQTPTKQFNRQIIR